MTERRVRDVMTRQVVTAREDTPYKELVALPAERTIAALPVVNAADEVDGVAAVVAVRERLTAAVDDLPRTTETTDC